MRIEIDIDDELMAEAMKYSESPTETAAVEFTLRYFVTNAIRRQALDELWGMGWEGDLDAMREGRLPGETALDDAAE